MIRRMALGMVRCDRAAQPDASNIVAMRGDSDPEQGTAMIHPGLLKDYGEGISLLQRYETASENSGYLTGKYSDHRFQQQSGGQIDYGSAAYAQKTMPDEKGRRIWWA
jgi:sucrose-6-phosphate hydrolase SacC (GH32 family)